ncbi:MAG: hypothetical protein RIE53_13800 [Rhodothermales bacterium]
MRTDRDTILDQVAYLIDELTAQLPHLERLPEDRFTLAPFGGQGSIRDRYADMLRLEREEHLPHMGAVLPTDTPEDDASTVAIVEAIVAHREALVQVLSSADEWDEARASYLHQLAIRDAERLRDVAEQFFEMRS